MPSKKSVELRKITPHEFARRLRVTASEPDARFAFFLGAGASRSSGIPLAGELVRNDWLARLRDLRAPDRKDLDGWAREELRAWSADQPGSSYGEVMEKLFLTPEERQREIERVCNLGFPGFGYAVLAALMTMPRAGEPGTNTPNTVSEGRFNVVLTTNFDDLVQDALFRFRDTRPLVIHHEALAGYIRPTRTRPLVIKLHGDHSLSPQNTAAETASLKQSVEQNVRSLLNDRGLVFFGYGGNDESIFKMLEGLPDEAIPFGIYWVSRRDPRGPMRSWLEDRQAIWVEASDFDFVMDLLRNAFSLVSSDSYSRKILDEWENVQASNNSLFKGMIDRAIRSIDPTSFSGIANYADFVFQIQGKPVSAARMYSDLVAADKSNSDAKSRYAEFLTIILESDAHTNLLFENCNSDYLIADSRTLSEFKSNCKKLARELYHEALELNDGSSQINADFAIFLEQSGEIEEADRHYVKAIELNPENPDTIGNYAGFLQQRLNDNQKARSYYKMAAEKARDQGRFDWSLQKFFEALTLSDAETGKELIQEIKKIVDAGHKVSGELICDATEAHPYSTWLPLLVEVLIGKKESDVLVDWAQWHPAPPKGSKGRRSKK